jgi:recombination protein RecR
MTTGFPAPLSALIEALADLPGIGARTAERIAFHLLRVDRTRALGLAEAVRRLRDELGSCPECQNLCTEGLCGVCRDPGRDRSTVMVVESPREVLAFERTGRYRGLYHVLLGRWSPQEGAGVDDRGLSGLRRRLAGGTVREVVLATNPDAEGDGTALAVLRALRDLPVTVTRLSRGLSRGSSIEHSGVEILAEALEGRRAPAAEED